MKCRILTSLVLITMLTACGPRDKKTKISERSGPPPAAPKKPAPPKPSAPSCATANDQSLADGAVVQRQTIQVRMEKQRVIRKSCKGDIVSDKMEKVTYPEATVVLQPKSWMGLGKTMASVFNRTSCSGPGLQFESILETALGLNLWQNIKDNAKNAIGFPKARLKVNTSPTVSNMHVRKNQDNYIDYEFLSCEADTCLKTKSMEKGTLIITVQYSENLDIGGVKEIKEECPEAQPKTP